MSVSLLDAVVLGVVEGLTEFLPVSSTGHLTITEGLLGLEVDDPSVTAFTAVIQFGAISAALLFFSKDIVRMARAFLRGLGSRSARAESDFRFALAVVLGSLPIGVVGLLFEDVVKGPVLRSLTTVGIALILWSGVMVLAERRATQVHRGEQAVTVRMALVIGITQAVALVPGVSRSGATISAGLLLGLDRVTATRLAFLLGIPSLTAAALYQLPSALSEGVGAGPTLVGTLVSFAVGYASIAWLLKFVGGHPITWFVPYRIALGVAVLLGVAVTS